MQKRTLIHFAYVSLLSSIVFVSCNNSQTETKSNDNDTLSQNSDTTKSSVAAVADSAAVTNMDFPTFRFYQKGSNRPSLESLRGHGARSLRFLYRNLTHMSVNGTDSDCGNTDPFCDDENHETENGDRYIEYTGQSAPIERPRNLGSRLILRRQDIEAILSGNPNFDNVVFTPYCYKPSAAQVDSIQNISTLSEANKKYYTKGSSYLTYQFSVGRSTYMLNPRPPGSGMPAVPEDSSKDSTANSKKSKDKK